jgi:hypothetical protein
MHILRYHSYPINVPTIKYFHNYMVKHVIMPVTIANYPLDRRLNGHALLAHTYLGVSAMLQECNSSDIYGYFIYEGYLHHSTIG